MSDVEPLTIMRRTAERRVSGVLNRAKLAPAACHRTRPLQHAPSGRGRPAAPDNLPDRLSPAGGHSVLCRAIDDRLRPPRKERHAGGIGGRTQCSQDTGPASVMLVGRAPLFPSLYCGYPDMPPDQAVVPPTNAVFSMTPAQPSAAATAARSCRPAPAPIQDVRSSS